MKPAARWKIKAPSICDLKYMIAALPHRANTTEWEVSEYVVENGKSFFETNATGRDRLQETVESGHRIPHAELLEIAQTTTQVIWGTLRGFDRDAEPWIEINAVDSSYWECAGADPATLKSLLKSFPDSRIIMQ